MRSSRLPSAACRRCLPRPSTRGAMGRRSTAQDGVRCPVVRCQGSSGAETLAAKSRRCCRKWSTPPCRNGSRSGAAATRRRRRREPAVSLTTTVIWRSCRLFPLGRAPAPVFWARTHGLRPRRRLPGRRWTSSSTTASRPLPRLGACMTQLSSKSCFGRGPVGLGTRPTTSCSSPFLWTGRQTPRIRHCSRRGRPWQGQRNVAIAGREASAETPRRGRLCPVAARAARAAW
mmetsp:Transcript_119223/g.337243  ORF Transcript_119223/g.337243 Transcript_119223/m.337243 type:complete len:231 (+) Transcript_119223:93-785(+)